MSSKIVKNADNTLPKYQNPPPPPPKKQASTYDENRIKSEKQAYIIMNIAIYLNELDVEYCKKASVRFSETANRQDSMAVLNPDYLPTESELLRKQAEALHLLCTYVDTLKEIDALKSEIRTEKEGRDAIKKLFLTLD